MKSAYQRGRDDALAELAASLAETAELSRRAAENPATPDDIGARQPVTDFDRGIFIGIACAHAELAKQLSEGHIPKRMNGAKIEAEYVDEASSFETLVIKGNA